VTSEHSAVPRLPEELVNSTAFLLKRLGAAAKEQWLEAYEATGLGPYHHAVLALLAESPPETQGGIADTLGYDRGQLVGILDELEEQGLVERRRDPNDRRRHTVRITPEGKRMHATLRALTERLEAKFFADLDDRQRAELHALLRLVARRHLPHLQ
jgi:DNA-binding MarR family transcriptional regulator